MRQLPQLCGQGVVAMAVAVAASRLVWVVVLPQSTAALLLSLPLLRMIVARPARPARSWQVRRMLKISRASNLS
jgi:hypothetical protein